MSDTNAQFIEVYRGELPVIPFAPPTATTVAGKTLTLYVSIFPGEPVLFTYTTSSGISVTDEAAGEFTWSIPRADLLTLLGERYTWELWDTTASERLAGGTLLVNGSSRPTS